MKFTQVVVHFYLTALSVFVALGAASYSLASGNWIFFLLFLPVAAHFVLTTFKNRTGHKVLLYYDFVLVTVMAIMGFVTAATVAQLVSAVLFSPLAFYFWMLVIPRRSLPLVLPQKFVLKRAEREIPEDQTPKNVDQNRRTFIKLLGSVGLGVLAFSLFSNKARLPFFGAVSGPGTVGLKDTSGTPVDPAVRNPTDGYRISEIDDSTPTFFGFIEKTGKWFIIREENNGAFRYSKGDDNFPSGWSNRASLTYDYYDAVF